MARKGSIPANFIEELVGRVDIIEIINQRVPLKRAGNSFKACCPFHQEKSPSFMVSHSKQIYHCFGCGAKGNVITFLMDYEHLEFVETIEYLANFEGLEIPYEKNRYSEQNAVVKDDREKILSVLSAATLFYQSSLKSQQDAITYLKNRNLTGDNVKNFKIGFSQNAWDGALSHLKSLGFNESIIERAGLIIPSQNNPSHFYDRFRNRIMFPIRNRKGEVIGFGGRVITKDEEPKYLNSPETEVFHKGKELYGLYELRKNTRKINEIIVVEGYMDVVMLNQHGIHNVVATLGTATSTQQIEQMFRYSHAIVFCFDGDQAGQNAAHKAMENALPALTSGKEIQFLFLPDQHDPDSYVRTFGELKFREAISNADPFSKYLFNYYEALYPLDSAEGRAKFFDVVGALINQMPDTSLRDILRQSLAEKTEINKNLLNKHVRKGVVPMLQNNFNDSEGGKSIIERALILLLNDFSLARQIGNVEFLLESEVKGAKVLYFLITTIADNPNLQTIGQLLVMIDQPKWMPWIEHLSVQDPMLDQALHLKEFQDILQQLTKRHDPKKLILQKLAKGLPISKEEKILLKQK